MSITTKKGDQGKSCWLGKTVDKDDLLVEVMGEIDELQCTLGIAKTELTKKDYLRDELEEIQKDLWVIAGELAGYKGAINLEKKLKRMELEIKEWERELPVIRDFVMPGENKKEATIQLCRAMVRRVERKMVSLSKRDRTVTKFLPYLNRLSDYLFMMAIGVLK